MNAVEAKKLLQAAMMGEHSLSEVDYAGFINTIINLQKEITELKSLDVVIDLQSENAELKAKLENAIVPKFKPDDYVWVNFPHRETPVEVSIFELIVTREQDLVFVGNIKIEYQFFYQGTWYKRLESELFASQAEAIQSLKAEGAE